MKRSLIVVVLVLVAFAASAEVTGAGVDLYASLQTARVAPDVDPTTDTYIAVTGSLMHMLDEGTCGTCNQALSTGCAIGKIQRFGQGG